MANIFRSILDALHHEYHATPPTFADGDWVNPQVDSNGFTLVNVAAGASIVGTSQADNTTFTQGTTTFAPIGGEYNTAPASVTSGRAAAVQITQKRALHVNLRDAAGNEWNAANPLPVELVTGAVPEDTALVDTSFGTATKHTSKGSAGIVRSVFATNQTASARWLQLLNKASTPAGADVPIFSFQIPAGSAANPGVLSLGADYFGAEGFPFATGVSWSLSTARATFVDTATNTDADIQVVYE